MLHDSVAVLARRCAVTITEAVNAWRCSPVPIAAAACGVINGNKMNEEKAVWEEIGRKVVVYYHFLVSFYVLFLLICISSSFKLSLYICLLNTILNHISIFYLGWLSFIDFRFVDSTRYQLLIFFSQNNSFFFK